MRSGVFASAACLFLASLAAIAGTPGPVNAQDRVTFIPPGASDPVVQIGEILDYTGRELTIRPATGSLTYLDAESIRDIQTSYDPAHLRGLKQFSQGDLEGARIALNGALRREDRKWMVREIQSVLVQIEMRAQNLIGAMRIFRDLAHSDPVTRHWGIAPLIWSPQPISDALKSEMRLWLTENRPTVRLLAASVLLLDTIHGDRAERELNELSRDANPCVATYSRTQLWRLDLAARNISDLTIERWQGDIQRLSKSLRPGPQYLLARGHEIRGELRGAAAEALWLPYVYPANEPLAARATFDAAEALFRTGLTTEASILYREVLSRYAWCREVPQARARLGQIVGENNSAGAQ